MNDIKSDNKNSFLLLVFAIYIFFVPLNWLLPFDFSQSRLSWNAEVASLGLVLLLYCVFSPKNTSKKMGKKSVLLSLALTIVLLARVLLVPSIDNSLTEVVRLLLLIWLIPFISRLFSLYGRTAVFTVIICIAVLYSQWSIAQFVLQDDLQLYIIGETRLDVAAPGIAKFLTSDHKLIRAYGPTPHPNIVGGILAMALIAFYQLRWSNKTTMLALSATLILGLLTTFSRAAWLSAVISAVMLVTLSISKYKNSYQHIVRTIMGFIVITVLVFTPFLYDRSHDVEDVATIERIESLHLGQQIWRDRFWTGTGIGEYTTILRQYMEQGNLAYEPWQIAPIHSVPALLAAEWGVIGLVILVLSIVSYSIFIQREFSVQLVSSAYIERDLWVLPTVPLLLLDHYLLTETAPMVWCLVLGIGVWMVRESQSDVQ